MGAQKMEQVDPIKNLNSILDLFQGKSESKTTGGSTIKTSVDFSEAQVADQIRSILGSTQGLASIASGEKLSGMYNTTSKQQAMNDLLAKITSEVTAKKVGTTVTKSAETTKAEAPAPLGEGKGLQALLGLGASSLLAPSVKRLKGKLGIPDLGESLADMLFGSGVGAAEGGVSVMGATAGGAAEAFAAAYPAIPEAAAAGGELGTGLFGMTELDALLGGTTYAGGTSYAGGAAAGGTASEAVASEAVAAAAGGAAAGGAASAAEATAIANLPAASSGSFLEALGSGPALPLVVAALYLDQNTKNSRLTDIVSDAITNPGQAFANHVSNMGDYLTFGLFK